MSAALLVRLKITDLTAWTALDSGRRLLPQDHVLARLVREELTLFEPAAGASARAFEKALQEAIATSNFFVNPNKESYRFLVDPDRGEALAPPEGAWGLLTRPRGATADEGLRVRLLREHPLAGLGAIRRGRVWWIWTRGPDGSRAVEVAYRALGPLEGSDRGLLANPHAEASARIEGPMPWKDVEAFMAAPDEAAVR